LINCLIGKSAGSTDDTYFTGLMDIARHDAYFALVWFDDAGTVWTDYSGFGLREESVFYFDHVMLGDTVGYYYD
jgi:hypothetical protein